MGDDNIFSGRTTAVACSRLVESRFASSICLAIHAVFAGDAYEQLRAAGACTVVTTNTIPHRFHANDASLLLAKAVLKCTR